MTPTPYTIKSSALAALRRRYAEQRGQVLGIESRLADYFDGLVTVEPNADADPQDPQPAHNIYELLGGLKFLRLLRTYPFNVRKVHQVIRLREGIWQQNARGRWQHVKGGIRQPLTTGDAVLRWEPFQVFILASIYGFHAWIPTGVSEDEKPDLLPSERVRGGMVEDLRRLCTDFTLYGPRKIDKTGISAFVAQEHFLLEDPNSESYCCANSEAQSKLLYRRIKHGLFQLNFDKRWRITEKITDWTKKYQVEGHTSSITPLSAGSTTKDGLFGQLCCADEYGSAGYTNGKSDMKRLVDVVESSMGPRREPLTVTTTTAGRITSGPFIEKLDSLHRLLEREMDWDTGEAPPLSYDRSLCILLEPDEWERQTEETLLTSKAVRRKINPMLGKIVQYQFYDDAVAKARMDGDLGEVISKLFNVYESGRLTQWIKSDRIRPLQMARSITDCKFADGWQVFVGLDFSHGDDLFAITYMGVNYTPSPTMAGKFFADMDAWVLEKTMQESPNRPLYEQWVEQGHLHVCPGEVFDSTYAINRLGEIVQQGINIIMFGFDPAQNAQPINQLKAWLQTLFQNRPDIGPKDMAAIIQQMVVPVPQTAMTQNPRIGELEHMILEQEPWLNFSQNPMWPWEFGNTAAMVNTSDLRRLVKGGPAPSHKMDNVAALVDALYLFDITENRVVE